jgi:hypothetical protein
VSSGLEELSPEARKRLADARRAACPQEFERVMKALVTVADDMDWQLLQAQVQPLLRAGGAV